MNDESRQRDRARVDGPPSIAQGAALHQAGRLEEAAGVYSEILSRRPKDFDATHLLGLVALQQGRLDDAQRLISAAIAVKPYDTAALGNLAAAYLRDGKYEPALKCAETALRKEPKSVLALVNAATALHQLGRFSEAIPLLQRAHALDKTSYAVCNLLGACLMKMGEQRTAADMLETATRIQPEEAEAWANLAIALQNIGQMDRARECADKAAALNPSSATALEALAGAQFEQGRVESLESYRQAVAAGPPTVRLLLAYANALATNGLHDEAVEQLQRAMALDDKDLQVRWALAIANLKSFYRSEAEVVESRAAFGRALDEIKAWYERNDGIATAYKAVGKDQPFYLAYQPFDNRDLLARYGALCATFMATVVPPPVPPSKAPKGSRTPTERGSKLRLGIVSAEIRNHSVWNAITKGWVGNLDQTKFEVHLFHLDYVVDEDTQKAKQQVFRFEDRPTTTSGWIEAIRSSDLDIILYPDIGMSSKALELASLRLAPVQAASWGHPETTGLPTMDLYFSAEAFEPPDACNFYSEKLIALPNLGVYLEPLTPLVREPDLKALRLRRDEALLLCPGQPFKYYPGNDEVWVRIAKGLRRKTLFRSRSVGRLVFFRSSRAVWNLRLESRLREAFSRGGVDFDAHVSFIPALERPLFFGLMDKTCLMLDTLGFSGFNTAMQAVECGLPYLAFEGAFMRGRLGSGIMRQLNLPELVATTTDEFVAKAVELTQNADMRAELKAKIEERRGGLFGDIAPVRALECRLMEASERARV
jgi:predicted O-linked N-acetylglucosamine transferase (SPINDLY family)